MVPGTLFFVKSVKLRMQEYLINQVEKAMFRKRKTWNTFRRKHNIAPARTPYKTCEKGMVPETMIFVKSVELRKQEYLIKPVKRATFRKTPNMEHFSSQTQHHARQNPYKTCEKDMVPKTDIYVKNEKSRNQEYLIKPVEKA